MAFAFLVPSHLPWYLVLLCAVFTIAGIVVVSKEFRRRFVIAAIVASLGAPFVTTLRADDDEFVVIDRCKRLTPDDFEYWMRSCWLYDGSGEPPTIVVIDSTTTTTTTTSPSTTTTTTTKKK